MPIQMRNPFRKTPGEQAGEENARPVSAASRSVSPSRGAGQGRPAIKPLDIRANGVKQPAEYKLSEINDSGVFLPPSPTERPTFWSTRSQASTNSSKSHRSVFNENEPFHISRESFDSYRRSFDICARSPVTDAERERCTPRHSLDTRRLRQPTFSSTESSPPLPPQRLQAAQPLPENHLNPPEEQAEERFEDVGLNEDAPAESKAGKRPGLFSRFGGGNDAVGAGARPGSSGHFWGRKRGASGQGSELGSLNGGRTPGPGEREH